jgi:formate hydrogenlyase transcriptional activator
MSGDMMNAVRPNSERYAAVARISQTLSECHQPEDFARVLADTLGQWLNLGYLEVTVFQEDSTEIMCHDVGRGPCLVSRMLPNEARSWYLQDRNEPIHIGNWSEDGNDPRIRAIGKGEGVDLSSVIRLPLSTPHRRVGTLVVGSSDGVRYSQEDFEFLQVIARIVAFAADDAFHQIRARMAQADAQRRSERLELLLDLTRRITSKLELQQVLRAVLRNLRTALQSKLACIGLLDSASGMITIYTLDSSEADEPIEEGEVFFPGGVGKRVLDTLAPALVDLDNLEAEMQSEIAQLLAARGLKTCCVIPLVNHGRALGLLALSGAGELAHSPEDLEFLQQISANIAIAIENALAYQEISELKDKLTQEKLYLEEEIRSELNFEHIVGNSPALRRVLELVETVAPSDSTVLLLGETGTGKELIARAIHERSRRRDRTFVKLNCSAIPTGLLESELFGHERGAFTGAISQKVGRMELADQGTLFLDEVGDIPLEIQPKLLRALQEREFERLGSTQTRRVNVRLIAATNRDLESMIAAREFRSDLYYRLHVFPIRIPPLRERREDIPLLVSFFVQKFAKQMQKKIESIPAALMKGLSNWDWPGNIRELENFMERAVILTRGKSLEAPLGELRTSRQASGLRSAHELNRRDLPRNGKEAIDFLNGKEAPGNHGAQHERQAIIVALTESKGRVGGQDGAAARLGLNRTTLIYRMRRFGIDPREYALYSAGLGQFGH